jgi:branched-chain amino acid aminotransferase
MAAFKKPKFVWMDGALVPFNEAKLHVSSPAVRYGFNVFEGLRGYWNEEEKELYCFHLKAHYQRLFESAKIMRFRVTYTIDECQKFLIGLLRANQFQEDVHIRHMLYLGGFGALHEVEPVGMHITALPRGRSYDQKKGIRCTISSWRRISDNSIPARVKAGSNYQNGRLASLQAKEDGYDLPIFLTDNGKVSEGPGACFFMVRKGVAITPPVTADILESITRKMLIELIEKELDIPVEEREVDRTETYLADEAFFCGTAAEITPIVSIDKLSIGDGEIGPITQKAMTLFYNIVRGMDPKYKEWVTPTYKNEK